MTLRIAQAALVLTAFVVALTAVPQAAGAEDKSPQQQAAAAKQAQNSKISLQRGLDQAQSTGKPISGKFEDDAGAPVLSIYTATDNGYQEVFVDPQTGLVLKHEVITDPGDLNDAQSHKAAMDRASQPLQAATNNAVQANDGFIAISIRPEMQDGHPVADITLVRNDGTVKQVKQKLD
jgi:hypothetical protein